MNVFMRKLCFSSMFLKFSPFCYKEEGTGIFTPASLCFAFRLSMSPCLVPINKIIPLPSQSDNNYLLRVGLKTTNLKSYLDIDALFWILGVDELGW